jgi:dynein heavy chain, axonemal
VPTIDTKKYTYILDLMVKSKYPCIFVGESGTAKSVIISNYLGSLSSDNYMRLEINFSSRTTSRDVQNNLEDNIEKRSGRIFAPKIVGKQLIVMIDDLHMPRVDTYGTQQPIALLKFFIDKGYIYERSGNLEMKIIKETQVVSALLPPSVATMVDARLLSLFTTYNLIFPSQDNLQRIYNSILSSHLKKFTLEMQDLTSKITDCTLKLYKQIVELLPRTPVKFHYIFNLRDLSRVYEGLTRSTIDKFATK